MAITQNFHIKSFLGVPVFLKNGKLVGNLCCFDKKEYTFTDEDVQLLQTMSTFLTYVIELEHTKKQVSSDFEKLFTQNQSILHSLTEGVFGVDLDGNISFCNPSVAKITGYASEQLVGESPLDTFLSHKTAENAEFLITLTDGRTREMHSDVILTKEGHSLPVEYTCTPTYRHGNLIGVIVTFKDITERKKAEQLMLKTEKLSVAGQLAAGIAHEIRNPLTAIKGFLQMIESGEQKQAYLNIMKEEINRIELIVSELLILAKPQKAQLKKASIVQLVQDVMSILETQAIMHSIDLSFVTDCDGLHIICDANKIKQVFINLIKNAIEASQAGSPVEIHVTEKDHHALISVKDFGVGIPEDKLEKIGQPFYSTKEKGTGLGMMVSQNIIENHQGQLIIKSEVNKGTIFEVRIPIHSEKE